MTIEEQVLAHLRANAGVESGGWHVGQDAFGGLTHAQISDALQRLRLKGQVHNVEVRIPNAGNRRRHEWHPAVRT